MNQVQIGKFICELRREKNLTQEELAEVLGVNVKSVSRWENGNTMPDLSMLPILASELDVEVSELLNGRRMTRDELIELKGTIENLIEYGHREIVDKSRIWQINIQIGIGIISLAILSNYVPFLEVIFKPNAAEFVRGLLYGIGIAYDLVSVYNVSHHLALADRKSKLFKKKNK